MSKTLEELGYEKSENKAYIEYSKSLDKGYKTEIRFYKQYKVFRVAVNVLSMEELKAIYKYCEELGWI